MNPELPNSRQQGLAPFKVVVVAASLVLLGAGAAWFALQPSTPEEQLNELAQEYVRLATGTAAIDANYVDIYFGPAGLDSRNGRRQPVLAELIQRTSALEQSLASILAPELDARKAHLEDKVSRLAALLSVVSAPSKPSFDEELARLYGITLAAEAVDQQANLDALQELLPGRGSLGFRVAAFRNRLVIPADKRKAVFETALAECKRRTLEHWELGANEELTIEWSREVPAAWHRYLGNGQSVLAINDLSVAFLDSAIDIACHEGYPGHHAQYVLIDQQPNNGVEDTVTLLRSSEAIVLEGAANVGVDLAFSPQQKMEFERDVLAPIAGITLPDTEQYLAFSTLMGQFEAAIPPIVKDYYDGEIAFNAATFQLERDAMVASSSALLEYIDQFGTYSIGYTYAESQIRKAISPISPGNNTNPWNKLLAIVLAPLQQLPSYLIKNQEP
jgi:hypothetical protein